MGDAAGRLAAGCRPGGGGGTRLATPTSTCATLLSGVPHPPPPPPLAAACERPGELLVCSKCPNAIHPQCCGYGTPRMLRHLVGVGRHLTPGLSTANEFKNTHIKLQRPAGLDA